MFWGNVAIGFIVGLSHILRPSGGLDWGLSGLAPGYVGKEKVGTVDPFLPMRARTGTAG